jgi:hypothetical protein
MWAKMDFGLSRREESHTSTNRRELLQVKTRKSSILNETDVILASGDQPGNSACYSSPNSTNVADIHFEEQHSHLRVNMSSSGHGNSEQKNISHSRSFGRDDSALEAKIKTNEAYLAQLKSIDLKKYSFPNENKPKTDYTYARTTSYISSSNTEDCVMPNLCRRSRISPPNNRLINFPFSTSNTTQQHTNNTKTSVHIEYLYQKSCERLSFFQKMRTYLNNSNTNNQDQTTQHTSFTDFKQPVPGMVYSTSSTEIAPRLNIGQFGQFFDSEPDTKSTIVNQNLVSQTKVNQVQKNGKKKESNGCGWLIFWIIFGTIILAPFLQFTMQRLDGQKEFNFDEAMLNDFQVYLRDDVQVPIMEKSGYVWREANSMGRIWATNGVRNAEQIVKSTRVSLEKNLKIFRDYGVDAWTLYWPQVCQVTHQFFTNCFKKITYLYELLKETATTTTTNIVNTVEYKLPTFRGDDTETDAEKKEIIQNYHLLKEKIFSEAMQIVKSKSDKADVDVLNIRNELDQKFNYTLTVIANKMIDQSMQFELSKASHQKELLQMKEVLSELETRYSQSMEQLQEKLASQTSKLEEKNSQQMNLLDPEVRENILLLMKSVTSEEMSFQKIEEYINKTFYLYNADKTGMTDFASESVGGSILFTRCTEVFTDNSRWFTIFDVPITRLTISPRVVIQGTVQPGNCWAFKGSKGDLFIKLAAKITPNSFSLEHIPKELSLTGVIDSAPQNFTVYGYSNKLDITDDNRLLLGNFRYDNNSKSTLQFFDVQFTYEDTPIQVVELKIESNAGHKELTCLYKFRVHGKLFEQIQREKLQAIQDEKVVQAQIQTPTQTLELNKGEE